LQNIGRFSKLILGQWKTVQTLWRDGLQRTSQILLVALQLLTFTASFFTIFAGCFGLFLIDYQVRRFLSKIPAWCHVPRWTSCQWYL
jgi:hypothetical protein